MNCPNCQRPLADGAYQCQGCGAILPGVPPGPEGFTYDPANGYYYRSLPYFDEAQGGHFQHVTYYFPEAREYTEAVFPLDGETRPIAEPMADPIPEPEPMPVPTYDPASVPEPMAESTVVSETESPIPEPASVPEGFFYDETHHFYYRSEEGVDEAGAPVEHVTYYDPATGEYSSAVYPLAPPEPEVHVPEPEPASQMPQAEPEDAPAQPPRQSAREPEPAPVPAYSPAPASEPRPSPGDGTPPKPPKGRKTAALVAAAVLLLCIGGYFAAAHFGVLPNVFASVGRSAENRNDPASETAGARPEATNPNFSNTHVSPCYKYWAEDSAHVYFMSQYNKLYCMERFGSNVELIHDTIDPLTVYDFALIGDYLYLACEFAEGRSAYCRVPKTGGTAELLFVDSVSFLATDGESLYLIFSDRRLLGIYTPGADTTPRTFELPASYGLSAVDFYMTSFSVADNTLYCGIKTQDGHRHYFSVDLATGEKTPLLSDQNMDGSAYTPVFQDGQAHYMLYDAAAGTNRLCVSPIGADTVGEVLASAPGNAEKAAQFAVWPERMFIQTASDISWFDRSGAPAADPVGITGWLYHFVSREWGATSFYVFSIYSGERFYLEDAEKSYDFRYSDAQSKATLLLEEYQKDTSRYSLTFADYERSAAERAAEEEKLAEAEKAAAEQAAVEAARAPDQRFEGYYRANQQDINYEYQNTLELRADGSFTWVFNMLEGMVPINGSYSLSGDTAYLYGDVEGFCDWPVAFSLTSGGDLRFEGDFMGSLDWGVVFYKQ